MEEEEEAMVEVVRPLTVLTIPLTRILGRGGGGGGYSGGGGYQGGGGYGGGGYQQQGNFLDHIISQLV